MALALGRGTMVGWKRIVVTLGERIGKEHLTYAQGASTELIAMGLIQATGMYHLFGPTISKHRLGNPSTSLNQRKLSSRFATSHSRLACCHVHADR